MRTLRDAVYGVAVGDAVGLPVQFERRDTYHISDMIGHGTFDMPAGSWSDDTSLTIATCDSIRRQGKVDIEDIRRRFEMWYNIGMYTPFGSAYDIGGTCALAISRGHGMDDEYSNGNGSLMRIIPLAFVLDITDQEIRKVSAITHAHQRAMNGCVYYIHIAKGLLEGRDLKELILEYVPDGSIYSMAREIENKSRDEISSSGYVVDTFVAAMWCLLNTDNYKDCILLAANLGSDTDTVAAVAGGLAGIMYGYESIPKEWIETLQEKQVIDDTLFGEM